MKCPTCKDVTLVISMRQEIEVDHCPECRGVWLDRGELDKIVERSSSSPQSEDFRKYYGYKRKKSFLSEIFD